DHGRRAQLLLEDLLGDPGEGVGPLHQGNVLDVAVLGDGPFVEDEVLGYRPDEGFLAFDRVALLADLGPGVLKLRSGLAGGGDGDDLPLALGQLASPGPVQTQVTMPVEFIDDAEGRNPPVSGSILGREHLNPRVGAFTVDPPRSFETAEISPDRVA